VKPQVPRQLVPRRKSKSKNKENQVKLERKQALSVAD
jgi:hypothetical protein